MTIDVAAHQHQAKQKLLQKLLSFIFVSLVSSRLTKKVETKHETTWEVVVAQLVERSLLIPEVRGLKPVIGKNSFISNICLLSTVHWKDENKNKNRPEMAHFKKYLWIVSPVWPDVGIKSCPISLNCCTRTIVAQINFYCKIDAFKNCPKLTWYLCLFCEIICCQELAKIAQSGHTDGCIADAYIWKWSSWAVVVVKWSACSPSTPTIRVQILVFFCKLCDWKEQK